MKTLTVFTPAYNRAHCLPRCYESMKAQTSRDFIWMVIDDGSADNTRALVEGWQRDGAVEIIYRYQENQGMHGAHNTAYANITTPLNVCIDSDDYMPPDAVEKILRFWAEQGSERYSGIAALDYTGDGQVIGTLLPDVKSATHFALYNHHKICGDKKLIYRSELTRQFPYPLFEGEKYVGLAYKYSKIDEQYELLLLNEKVCCVEYQPDGSSNSMMRQYIRNPQGFMFIRAQAMAGPFGGVAYKFRQAVHFVSSSMFAGRPFCVHKSPKKWLTLLAWPFGLLLNIYIRIQNKK